MTATELLRLETARLVLRVSEPADAHVFRTLWTERDLRVPAHRRIGPDGRPTVDDIAAGLGPASPEQPLRLLTVLRSGTTGADGVPTVIGYCGLLDHGNGSPAEPELAYELRRDAHGRGYATEAAGAVVAWADRAGYPRLWAGVWDWNTASRRVLGKLGFVELERTGPRSEHGCSLLTVRERADQSRPPRGPRADPSATPPGE